MTSVRFEVILWDYDMRDGFQCNLHYNPQNYVSNPSLTLICVSEE